MVRSRRLFGDRSSHDHHHGARHLDLRQTSDTALARSGHNRKLDRTRDNHDIAQVTGSRDIGAVPDADSDDIEWEPWERALGQFNLIGHNELGSCVCSWLHGQPPGPPPAGTGP